ncbi:hypothetical protein HBB16_07475 [Pseudonocardia sp. MCCB 268]|nr:hypothetical protein [Pseudonocardia cytotoxica]
MSIQAQITQPVRPARARARADLPVHRATWPWSARQHCVGVMYLGRIVELRTVRPDLRRPGALQYTAALLNAVPRVNGGGRRATAALHGEIPLAAEPAVGNRFRTRCPMHRPLRRRSHGLAELSVTAGSWRAATALVRRDPQTGKGTR